MYDTEVGSDIDKEEGPRLSVCRTRSNLFSEGTLAPPPRGGSDTQGYRGPRGEVK